MNIGAKYWREVMPFLTTVRRIHVVKSQYSRDENSLCTLLGTTGRLKLYC